MQLHVYIYMHRVFVLRLTVIIIQISDEQLMCDTEDTMSIILQNDEYKTLMEQMTPADVVAAVDGGLHVLYYGPASGNVANHPKVYVYKEDCFVISVLSQWLIGFLCKRLMQLMPLEALIVQNAVIPHHYIHHYLKFQAHFCLKDVIENQFDVLKRNSMVSLYNIVTMQR